MRITIGYSSVLKVSTLGRITFVLSHPFARKKAKGWGTEFLLQTDKDLA